MSDIDRRLVPHPGCNEKPPTHERQHNQARGDKEPPVPDPLQEIAPGHFEDGTHRRHLRTASRNRSDKCGGPYDNDVTLPSVAACPRISSIRTSLSARKLA